jgi:hypothetical protein
MVKKQTYIISILIILLGIQCTSEKEVDLNLPKYDNKPVIECYLETGKPYRLFAYYSVGYFETPELIPLKNASIKITFEGQTIDLNYDTIPRPGEIKRYNYRANDLITVPVEYNKTFSISIMIDGITYNASTFIPQPIPIDSTIITCNDEIRCQTAIRFTDPVNENNFYRYITIADSLNGDVQQDFILNDELFENGKAGLGGGFNFNAGQKAIIKLMHINKAYYEFLNSVNTAQNANGNPFAQPANIKSNIPGLLGIFTGFSDDQKELLTP